MEDEIKLLLQLKDGCEGAIDKAIKIYTPYLSAVLYNTVGKGLPREDIEEIIADVFVMLWKNAGRIDTEKGTIRSYISAAARNFALKKLSRIREHVSLDDVDIADTDDPIGKREEADRLWDAVMKLGEPDSEIFVRFYKYDERIKDISKATGLNASTVKSKLSRGKKKLKQILTNAEVDHCE